MLDIKLIRQNPEGVKERLKKRNFDVEIVDKLLVMHEKYLIALQEFEAAKSKQNGYTEEIKKLGGKMTEEEKRYLQELKEKVKQNEIIKNDLKRQYTKIAYQLPNLPLPDAPIGKDEKDNKVLYEVGERPKFNFEPKKHYEIGESLDIIDTDRAARVSGSRFGYLKGQAALLEFALINFVLKKLVKKGFVPVIPPVLINEEMMKGMGYIDTEADKKEGYYLEKDKQYLVGTSEQSLGPMHSGEVFNEKDLPARYVGFSSCFRREAGSYGKDVRGIMRVHQFNKLEMFSYCRSEDSVQEHKFLLAVQEELVKELKLAYRVVQLCTGDLARPSAATFDIETWFPGLGEYKETHSCSNTTDFQSRRLNIRFKRKNGDLEFVHMLNGTAFAIGRTILAILENYQQKDGSIKIPKVLKNYLV